MQSYIHFRDFTSEQINRGQCGTKLPFFFVQFFHMEMEKGEKEGFL